MANSRSNEVAKEKRMREAGHQLQSQSDVSPEPEWDSSDDGEKEVVNESSQGNDRKKKSKGKGLKRNESDENDDASNVLYIGHLPREFQESELMKFLKQFGEVLNLRLSRSTKTGNTRCYAFCQMQSPEVAAIVADTLSGYIMFGKKRMVCHVVPADKVHPKLFRRQRIRKKRQPRATKPLSKIKEITEGLLERERKKRLLLKEMDIDYDFPGYEAAFEEQSSKVKQEDKDEAEVEEAAEMPNNSKKKEGASKKKKRSRKKRKIIAEEDDKGFGDDARSNRKETSTKKEELGGRKGRNLSDNASSKSQDADMSGRNTAENREPLKSDTKVKTTTAKLEDRKSTALLSESPLTTQQRPQTPHSEKKKKKRKRGSRKRAPSTA